MAAMDGGLQEMQERFPAHAAYGPLVSHLLLNPCGGGETFS